MKKNNIFILLFISSLIGQKVYFINNLIEKEGTFYNYMSNEPLSGKLFFNYLDDNNILESLPVGNLENGIKNGLWIRYWNNGGLKAKGEYINSLKNGLWVEWLEDGTRYLEILYKNDTIIHLTNCLNDECN